jgi:molybdenum cofactor synthesis domain-containing protein
VAELRIGVLTCSDTRARGEAEDTAGLALIELVEQLGWLVVAYHVCPDDRESISVSLMEMCDIEEADVVITCGGTGLGPRDVTPEATLDVADRNVPGIAEYLRAESLRVTKRAMLARGVAVQRGRTIIINMPGSEKAARESFAFVSGQLEHAVEMVAGGGHA